MGKTLFSEFGEEVRAAVRSGGAGAQACDPETLYPRVRELAARLSRSTNPRRSK